MQRIRIKVSADTASNVSSLSFPKRLPEMEILRVKESEYYIYVFTYAYIYLYDFTKFIINAISFFDAFEFARRGFECRGLHATISSISDKHIHARKYGIECLRKNFVYHVIRSNLIKVYSNPHYRCTVQILRVNTISW